MQSRPAFTALVVLALAATGVVPTLVGAELRGPFAAVLAWALVLGWLLSTRAALVFLLAITPVLVVCAVDLSVAGVVALDPCAGLLALVIAGGLAIVIRDTARTARSGLPIARARRA